MPASWSLGFRHAARALRRSPGFTGLAVMTLGLGIGAVTAIFSVVDGVLLEPLPYGEPQRAAVLWSSWKDFPETWVSWDEAEVYASEVPALAAVALWDLPSPVSLGGADEPERILSAGVSESLFRVLGVRPALGRGFLPAEDAPGGDAVAVISHRLWQRRFAGDVAILGRTLDVDGGRRRVVGVLPAGFRLPTDYADGETTDLLVPLAVDPVEYGAMPGPGFAFSGGSHTFYGGARLAPGATWEQADAQLASVVGRLTAAGSYPPDWGFRVTAVPLDEQVTGRMLPALRVLLAAGVLVLLVSCADLAGLLLVRGERRRAEVGLRTALGGGGWRLAGQLLAEGTLLGAAAGAVGLVLAFGAVAVVRAVAPRTLPRIDEVGVDFDALLLAGAIGLLTAVLATAISTVQAARVSPALLLREGATRASGRAGAARGRRAIVAAQAALTVMALAGAGLMVRSVQRLLAVDPGFRAAGVVTAQLSVPTTSYPEAADVGKFYRELVRRVESLPGVEGAAVVRVLPLGEEMGDRGVNVEGYAPGPGETPAAEWQIVSPGYFDVLGVRRLAGRLPDARDHVDAPPVMVVNDAFVKRYLAGRDPLGSAVRLGGMDEDPHRVIGVVADTRINSLTAEVRPRFYGVHEQPGFRYRTMNLVVRTSLSPAEMSAALRAELRRLDPRLATSEIRSFEEVVAGATAQPRFTMGLLSVFAALALALGGIGTYGLVAHAATERRREMGVRIAVGARPKHVLGLVLREGAGSLGAGLLIGAAAAAYGTRWLGSLLYETRPDDPVALGSAVLTVVAAGLLAAAGPAWRAARTDPNVALREE